MLVVVQLEGGGGREQELAGLLELLFGLDGVQVECQGVVVGGLVEQGFVVELHVGYGGLYLIKLASKSQY